MTSSHRLPGNQKIFWVLLFVLAYAGFEFLCITGLILLNRIGGVSVAVRPRFELGDRPRSRIPSILRGEAAYYPHSPTLGWTIKPGGRWKIYGANSQGFRADTDYTALPSPGTLRIAAFGDSFVHGSEVGNPYTWPAILGEMDPRLEVLNFGVGAYGLDQSFLRYQQDAVRFSPHVVLIGFMSENIHRSVNTFPPFYVPEIFEPRSKPRFLLDGDSLLLLENPLAKREEYRRLFKDDPSLIESLGEHDFYYQTRYRPGPFFFLPSARLFRFLANALSSERILADGVYNSRSEAFRVTTRIFSEFYQRAIEHRSQPIVVLFPRESDLIRFRESASRVYAPLLTYLESKQMRTVDVLECLQVADPKLIHFLRGGHYAPRTNRVVARCIHDALERVGMLDRV